MRRTLSNVNLLERSRIICRSSLVLNGPNRPSASLVTNRTVASTTTTLSSINLYNSLSCSIEPLQGDQLQKGIACYTCGPTVYAPAHLGHARTYIWLDIMRRCMDFAHQQQQPDNNATNSNNTYPPLFVMNITDVDDKILKASSDSGESPAELARGWEREFWNDLDALNCLRPHVVTRVTEHVTSDIIPYIQALLDKKLAYIIKKEDTSSDEEEDEEVLPGVYFDVQGFEDLMGTLTRYGKLAPPSQATDLFDLQQVKSTKKKNVRDFVLWKQRKPGELSYWMPTWGDQPGRPGWHIECSAMIQAVQRQFQDTHSFVLHCGGIDLKFPHHTNEIAQAEAYLFNDDSSTKEWIPHWVHTGHLHIDGLKMSKSLKNFITIREMLDEEDSNNSSKSAWASSADDFRLWCLGLSGSYRGAATYSDDRKRQAQHSRQKIIQFLIQGQEWILQNEQQRHSNNRKKWRDVDHSLFLSVHQAAVKGKRAILRHDLNGAVYLEQLIRIADEGNSYLHQHSTTAEAPTEPMQTTLTVLREMLSLVGFSHATCHAGLTTAMQTNLSGSHVIDQRALLDEMVKFRSAVRHAAIQNKEDNNNNPNEDMLRQRILELCDDARDHVFPSLGAELLDDSVEKTNRGRNNDDNSDGTSMSTWRYRIHRSKSEVQTSITTGQQQEQQQQQQRLEDIPLKDFFRVGPYAGQFSDFDEAGIPTKNADGTVISNRMFKKLQKKFVKHAKRLEKAAKTKSK